jgi:hypothetical protein
VNSFCQAQTSGMAIRQCQEYYARETQINPPSVATTRSGQSDMDPATRAAVLRTLSSRPKPQPYYVQPYSAGSATAFVLMLSLGRHDDMQLMIRNGLSGGWRNRLGKPTWSDGTSRTTHVTTEANQADTAHWTVKELPVATRQRAVNAAVNLGQTVASWLTDAVEHWADQPSEPAGDAVMEQLPTWLVWLLVAAWRPQSRRRPR